MRFIVCSVVFCASLLASSSAFACAMRPVKDHGPDLVALMEAVDATPAQPAVVEPTPEVVAEVTPAVVAEVTPEPAPAQVAGPSVIPEVTQRPMSTRPMSTRPVQAADPS